MASITHVITIRDNAATPPGTRKTGLTPTWVYLKALADNANLTQPPITEVAQGAYKFSFDAVALGEAAGQIDAGASLDNPSDRYIDVLLTADSSRITTGSSAAQAAADGISDIDTALDVLDGDIADLGLQIDEIGTPLQSDDTRIPADGTLVTTEDLEDLEVGGGTVDAAALANQLAAYLASSTNTFPGPFDDNGTLIIVAGDDYTAADRVIPFSKAYSGTLPTTLELRLIRQDLYAKTGDTTPATLTVTATPTLVDGLLAVDFAPTYTQTATLGPAREQGSGATAYRYRVVDPSARRTHWTGKAMALRPVAATA